jgi:hypothetical protein
MSKGEEENVGRAWGQTGIGFAFVFTFDGWLDRADHTGSEVGLSFSRPHGRPCNYLVRYGCTTSNR